MTRQVSTKNASIRFLLSLTSLKTGEIVWSDEFAFVKNSSAAISEFDEGIVILAKKCESNTAKACGEYYDAYTNALANKSVTKSESDKLFALFSENCEFGSLGACDRLAMLYKNGVGVSKNEKVALGIFIKGCDAKEQFSCVNLAGMYVEGSGVPQNFKKAFGLLKTACDAKNSFACTKLAELYANGQGVAQDYKKAAELLSVACNDGISLACSSLASMYAGGNGVGQDRKKAMELLEKACDGGNLRACYDLGVVYKNIEDDRRAANKLFEKTCNAGLPDACVAWADSGGPSLSRIGNLYYRACERNNALGCYRLLGWNYDNKNKIKFAQKACGLGLQDACYYIYEKCTSYSGTEECAKVKHFFDIACDGKDAEACYDLGSAYEQGYLVRKNLKVAAGLFRKSCSLGYENACEKVRKTK